MILQVIRLLIPYTLYIMGYDNYIQNGSHDCRGVSQSSGFEGKTHRVRSEPPKQPERGMMRHNGWPVVGTSGAPSWGPSIIMLHF
jgi:hypothetical protein